MDLTRGDAAELGKPDARMPRPAVVGLNVTLLMVAAIGLLSLGPFGYYFVFAFATSPEGDVGPYGPPGVWGWAALAAIFLAIPLCCATLVVKFGRRARDLWPVTWWALLYLLGIAIGGVVIGIPVVVSAVAQSAFT